MSAVRKALEAAGVTIDTIGGWCPLQAEGTILGKEFYFRSRGESWSIGIGGDPVMAPEWEHREPYGSGPFDAGYMPEDEALQFILSAAQQYAAAVTAAAQGEGNNGEEEG